MVLLSLCRGFHLLIYLLGALTVGGEFGGLGERLAEVGGGMLDVDARVSDVGLGFGLVGFKSSELQVPAE
jgi:hypothetical protein